MPNLSRRETKLSQTRRTLLGVSASVALLGAVACGSDPSTTVGDGPGGMTPGDDPGGMMPPGSGGGGPGTMEGGGGTAPDLPPVPPDIPDEACAGDGVFPGVTDLRRLSNVEYINSIQDLIGLAKADLDLVPEAEILNGVVSQQHTDKYLRAANYFAETARAEGQFALPCAAEGEACATDYIKETGSKAFRRPLTDDEVADYLARYRLGAEGEGGFEEGLEWVLGRILQSPHFLHRIELEGQGKPAGVPVALTSHSVATRLSYFLWQSMPDEELRAAADADMLLTQDAVTAQVDRMIASDKFDQTLRSFHNIWLGVDSVLAKEKVAEITPAWGPNLKLDMVEEIERFVAHVYKSGGTFTDLFTSTSSFLSPDLASLYGVTHPGGEWPMVEIPNRYGLLTMGGVLASHASEIQSHPVKRGTWIRQQLLCTPLPSPPTDLGEITEPEVVEGQTTADAFEAHRDNPACAACHTRIDPLGLPFENYDEFGRYRTMDRGVPVVAAGELTATDAEAAGIDPVVSGPEDFAAKFSQLPMAQECAVSQWVKYGIGRDVDVKGVDKCTVINANKRFRDSQFSFKELIVGLATSDAFRFRVEQ